MIKETAVIKIEHVSAKYVAKEVLKDVSLTVFENDFLGIIGPNGGGKTTLLRILLGLLKPAEGSVTYYKDGNQQNEINMGYLPQYNYIDKKFPISVDEVILSGLGKKKRTLHPFTNEQHEQVKQTMAYMGLEELAKRSVGTLSGGQLQRVLLARAIVSKPDVLVLDEPNTYIDQHHQEQMYEMLADLNKSCAIIITSHDVGTILENVKNVACVNRTLHYHSVNEMSEEMLETNSGCPIELIAHGDLPHRVLRKHND